MLKRKKSINYRKEFDKHYRNVILMFSPVVLVTGKYIQTCNNTNTLGEITIYFEAKSKLIFKYSSCKLTFFSINSILTKSIESYIVFTAV